MEALELLDDALFFAGTFFTGFFFGTGEG